jgi:CPA1 family monovalent cation:H+ antiporter
LVDNSGAPIPLRDLVLVLAIGVIVISLVVQGFTLAPLVRRAGLVMPERRDEVARAWQRLEAAALSYLDGQSAAVDPNLIEQARRSVIAGAAMATADSGDPGYAYRQLRRDVLARQDAELARMYRAGEIGEPARRRLQRQLDLQAERFTGP